MREIKFRAWDCSSHKKEYAKMLGYLELQSNCNTVYMNDCVLMQYTGLKDKNGKEIYEGDVVRNFRGIDVKIEWGCGGFYYTFTDDGGYGREEHIYWLGKDCEVLGNIFENKELI